MKTIATSFLVTSRLAGVWFPAELGLPDRPHHEGKVILFGNLHAHSKLSADILNAGDELLPSKAIAYAHLNGLDFLAISDHHKATDSSLKRRLESNCWGSVRARSKSGGGK